MLFLTSDFAHVVSLPGTPFIPFYFINPYSSLTIQLRCHFLLLPGWIRYPILLYISIRVISTLNQFVFLFKSKLHALRGCFVYHCLLLPYQGAFTMWQQFSYLRIYRRLNRAVHIEDSILYCYLIIYDRKIWTCYITQKIKVVTKRILSVYNTSE